MNVIKGNAMGFDGRRIVAHPLIDELVDFHIVVKSRAVKARRFERPVSLFEKKLPSFLKQDVW